MEPLPNQSSNQVAPSSHVTATHHPDPEENSEVYFDHLVTGPPTPSKKGQRSLPQQPPQQPPVEEDNVYFDHLVGKYHGGAGGSMNLKVLLRLAFVTGLVIIVSYLPVKKQHLHGWIVN